MLIDDLATPCILIERFRMENNLQSMQTKAEANGVKLRPHTKTHKSLKLAQRQLDHGACGVTVAKVGEAEVFVKAGFDDVRIAYTIVGKDKLERIRALMSQARLSFCVDTLVGAKAASDFFFSTGSKAEVLIEIDGGYGRCGVRWDDRKSIDFARYVSELPGLRLVGILTHAGQSYSGPISEDETVMQALERVSATERDTMLEVAARFCETGIDGVIPDGSFEISIGSTPSMRYFENGVFNGFSITEIRPGNYIFNDATQVGLSSAALKDCAATVLATVVSKQREHTGQERLFLDAGRKVLTSDTGYGTVGYGILLYSARTMEPLPHARVTGLSEEHGWVTVSGGATLSVGDRIRLIPNHACVTVNTQDKLMLVDGENVLESITVDARGRVS